MRKALAAALVILIVAICSLAPATHLWASSPSAAGPEHSATYVVREGDCLYTIARRFGTTVRALAQANDLIDPDLIYPGQILTIPGVGGQASGAGGDVAVAGGEVAAIRDQASNAQAPALDSRPLTSAMTQRETAMLEAINSQRIAAGLAALRFEPALMPVARARSSDMATRNYFSHTTPEGGSVQDLVRAAGLRYTWVNEILARNNYPDEQSVSVSVTAFMNSHNHRGHILSPVYARAAVGEARTPEGMKYFTVMLASAQ